MQECSRLSVGAVDFAANAISPRYSAPMGGDTARRSADIPTKNITYLLIRIF